MARRKKKEGATVSLFPFLSILACVIGTLTLMITALALGQMDNDTIASAEKYQEVIDKIKAYQELIDKLKAEIAKLEAATDGVQKELADTRNQLNKLKLRRKNLQDENEEEPEPLEMPTADTAKLQKRIEQLEAELLVQDEAKKELVAELKKRKAPPEEAQVIIQPGGSGYDLDPTFVECTAAGIAILGKGQPKRVRKADLATDEVFLNLLKMISQSEKKRVIFLVRDDALPTYYAARDVALINGALNGKLPVIGHGKIDLSIFDKN